MVTLGLQPGSPAAPRPPFLHQLLQRKHNSACRRFRPQGALYMQSVRVPTRQKVTRAVGGTRG